LGYASGVTFSQDDLAALAAEEEIRIETRSGTGEAHRTIIWVVVGDGVVYIRSVNGATARWYREALADPSVTVHVGGRNRSTAAPRALPARVVPATDPASVEACSAALRAKYATDPALRTMLREHTLPTTLRVEAA
jgi:hypothetical protein